MRTSILLLALLAGCARHTGPDVLRLESAAYDRAFDAAVEAARKLGMPPSMRDRRAGVIETEPRIAGSLIEPWRVDNASLGQATDNTIASNRRVARFEFSVPGPVAAVPPAAEPDPLAAREPPLDLTTYVGELELRVRVFIERAYVPGTRRNTWSREMSSRATIVSPATGAPDADTEPFWTPVTRDLDYEHRLLAAVAETAPGAFFADPQVR